MNSLKVLGEGSHDTRTIKIVLDMIKRYDHKTPSFIAAINATIAIISYRFLSNFTLLECSVALRYILTFKIAFIPHFLKRSCGIINASFT
jgi:hypothetical protein